MLQGTSKAKQTKTAGRTSAAAHDRVQGRAHGRARRDRFAAIDLGTHNCRMLIAEAAEPGSEEAIAVVDGFSRVVCLGEGLSDSGCLCEEAVERTISALRVCSKKLRRHRVKNARYVATEACRQADNCGQFFATVKEATGIELETIPPEEEARLTLRGCEPLLATGHAFALMFDIGGGSTELTWVDLRDKVPEVRRMMSLPIGVVNLSEKHHFERCNDASFFDLVSTIRDQLCSLDEDGAIADAARDGELLLLGTSGTVTTLGALHLGLQRYDRRQVDGLTLSLDDVQGIVCNVLGASCAERADLPCIGADRADLMVMGCAILSAILAQWPAGTLRVADRGIREGILLDMINGA